MSDIEETVRNLQTLIARHAESEGFCRCDGQPWPCDVRILASAVRQLQPSRLRP